MSDKFIDSKGGMWLTESGCCDPWSSHVDEVNGECPDCGMPTVDGFAAHGCSYSPCVCETCRYKPCDGSC